MTEFSDQERIRTLEDAVREKTAAVNRLRAALTASDEYAAALARRIRELEATIDGSTT